MSENPWSHPARWSTAWLLFVALLSTAAGWGAASMGHARGLPSPSSPASSASASAQLALADPLPTHGAVVARSSANPTSRTAAAASDEIARASGGDLVALKRIELRPPRERTIAESLALEAGHSILARQDAERLVQDLRAEPKLLRDRSTLAYAYRVALDPAAAPRLLAGLADIADPNALDLLFDLVARGDPGSRWVLLAVDLLASARARGNASRPLRVALDLRDARDCWQVAEVVARAIEDGDDRSLPMLERLRTQRGCGAKRQDDCHGCLRQPPHEDRLEKALAAVRSRAFNAPWRSAERAPH